MQTRSFLITTLFSFAVLFCSAQFSIEKGNIPASFEGFRGKLLIQNIHSGKENGNGYLDGVNAILEKRFTKFYKGEFEMVEDDELSKGRYKDTKTYRFVLQLIFDHQSGANTFFYKFKMSDRVTSTSIETDLYPDSTIPPYSFINSYAKALEKLRGKE